MNANYTAIGVVLDRSGSMDHLAAETIHGFNVFLKEQKALPSKADLTLALFDHEYITLYDGVDLQSVPDLNSETYVPRGSTALLDAMGRTISQMGARFAAMAEEDRPGKVILVVLTDGEENCSHEFSRERVMEMVKHQQEKYGWEVLYFGANQDAIAVGASMGVNNLNSVSYAANSKGISHAYGNISSRVLRSRSGN